MTVRFSRHWLAACAALALVACSGQSAEQSAEAPAAVATHPETGLEIIPVTLQLESGAHVIQAEHADTPDAQARGLMFRAEMGADEGMIFTYQDTRDLSFWMRNTVIPLDLIFIDANRQVINIEQGIPYDENPVASDAPGVAVLELNAGRSEELGLQPGDTIEW